MKLKIEKVYIIIKNALMLEDVINEDSSTENTEGWDSLGQLSILSALDKEFKGATSKIKELSGVKSVKEIIGILKSHGLLEDES